MSSRIETEFLKALTLTGLVHPLDVRSRGGRIQILCKQVPGQEASWLKIVNDLLNWAEASAPPDSFLIARRYLLKEGKMVFGWHIELTTKNSKSLEEVLSSALQVLSSAKPSLTGLVESRKTVRSESPKEDLPPIPQNASPSYQDKEAIRRVKFAPYVDENGQDSLEVMEYPLPHTYGDTLIPNSKGKGASSVLKADHLVAMQRGSR